VERRLAASHLDVVTVEGDIDGAELDCGAGEVLDQAPQALRERHPAGVDADQRDAIELGIALDDLVRDPVQRALQSICIEEDALSGGRMGRLAQAQLLSGLTGPI
jgi:hypothetical protein